VLNYVCILWDVFVPSRKVVFKHGACINSVMFWIYGDVDGFVVSDFEFMCIIIRILLRPGLVETLWCSLLGVESVCGGEWCRVSGIGSRDLGFVSLGCVHFIVLFFLKFASCITVPLFVNFVNRWG